MVHVPLPVPPMGPHSLSTQVEALAINVKHEDYRQLPSIHDILNGTVDTPRRPSTTSTATAGYATSSSSVSSTPILGSLDLGTAGHPPGWCTVCGDKLATSTSLLLQHHSAQAPMCISCSQNQPSSRPRMHQANGYYQPYPTPHTSPVLGATKGRKATRAGYSARQRRYEDSSGTMMPEGTRNAAVRRAAMIRDHLKKTARDPIQARAKAEKEQGSRKGLTLALATLEKLLVNVNPEIRARSGWHDLKKHNCTHGLSVNKIDIITSAWSAIEQQRLLNDFTLKHLQRQGHQEYAQYLMDCQKNLGCPQFTPRDPHAA